MVRVRFRVNPHPYPKSDPKPSHPGNIGPGEHRDDPVKRGCMKYIGVGDIVLGGGLHLLCVQYNLLVPHPNDLVPH